RADRDPGRLRCRAGRQAAAVHRGRGRAGLPAAGHGVPQPAHPAGGLGDEPAVGGRRAWPAERGLRPGLGRRAARAVRPQSGRGLRPGAAVLDPVRAVHGLRGVPGQPDARALAAEPGQPCLGDPGPGRDRPGDHRRGHDHDPGLPVLPVRAAADHRPVRGGPGRGGDRGRLPDPHRAGPGGHAPVRHGQLVAAALAGPGPAAAVGRTAGAARPGRAGWAGSGRRGRRAPVIQARPGPGGWDHRLMPLQFDPPSGTRDFLAAELETRQRAFAVIDRVYTSYGFEPLQTPAFERLDVLMGKYGDEGDKLIFKILRRGEHEASGEADLALRYDLTVPLARVAAAYGSRLPSPYKRYALGPVWRADRPGKGRYREFTQCDLDTLGSASLLADAEVVCAQNEALTGLGVPGFGIKLNSRLVLTGL